MAKNRKNRKGNSPVTWPQAARDITVSAINRGQLLLLGCVAIVMLLIWKMPGEDVTPLVREILQKLEQLHFIAYILLGITLAGWYAHAKVNRRNFSEELRRVGNEKSKLQALRAGNEFKSSERS